MVSRFQGYVYIKLLHLNVTAISLASAPQLKKCNPDRELMNIAFWLPRNTLLSVMHLVQ